MPFASTGHVVDHANITNTRPDATGIGQSLRLARTYVGTSAAWRIPDPQAPVWSIPRRASRHIHTALQKIAAAGPTRQYRRRAGRPPREAQKNKRRSIETRLRGVPDRALLTLWRPCNRSHAGANAVAQYPLPPEYVRTRHGVRNAKQRTSAEIEKKEKSPPDRKAKRGVRVEGGHTRGCRADPSYSPTVERKAPDLFFVASGSPARSRDLVLSTPGSPRQRRHGICTARGCRRPPRQGRAAGLNRPA